MHPFFRGVLGGAASLAVTGVGRALGLVQFLPELMALKLFEVVPLGVFEFFVRRLGVWSKWVAFGGMVGAVLLASGALGVIAARWWGGKASLERWLTLTLAVGAASALFLLALGVEHFLGQAVYPRPRWPALIAVLLGSGAYAAAYTGLFVFVGHDPLEQSPDA